MPFSEPGKRRWLAYRAVLLLGRLAAQVKLCRVWQDEGGRLFRKRRWPLADQLVWPLNFALASLDIPLEVLLTPAWLERERNVLGQTLGRWVSTSGNVLTTERLPGCCLRRYLHGRDSLAATAALTAAARALRELHDAGVCHSDAALHNALYDESRGVVAWLDFETRYRAAMGLPWCQAHDLAALLASAAKAVRPEVVPELVGAVNRGYANPDRLGQAGQLLSLVSVLLVTEIPWDLGRLDLLREQLARL